MQIGLCLFLLVINTKLRYVPGTALGLFSSDFETSVKRFKEFNEAQNQDCLDDTFIKKLTDEEARIEINKLLSGVNIAQVKSLIADKRDMIVKRIKG